MIRPAISINTPPRHARAALGWDAASGIDGGAGSVTDTCASLPHACSGGCGGGKPSLIERATSAAGGYGPQMDTLYGRGIVAACHG